MTYVEWCEKYIGPILDQWNDGCITADEVASAIYQTFVDKGVGTPDGWTPSQTNE